MIIEIRVLRQISYQVQKISPTYRLPIDAYPAPIRPDEIEKHADSGTFPRAIEPYQAIHRPRRNLQTQPIYGLHRFFEQAGFVSFIDRINYNLCHTQSPLYTLFEIFAVVTF
jgi:hypothetical protein